MQFFRRFFQGFCGILLVSLSFCALAANPAAETKASGAAPVAAAAPNAPQPPNINAKAYVLMDANTGTVLAQQNMDEQMAPASLTKLMTAYVASKTLKAKQIKLEDQVTISEKAWRMQGSRMFVQVGTQVSVADLLHGIIVASGNDACVALAEHIAGTEDAFVQLMNQNAQRLGMTHTHYTDSTGMPDPNHYTSAYDQAQLTRAIVADFPEDYGWYKQQWIQYNNIRQPNRNRLLWRDPSVDGLKTGHTDDAGYCLVASAARDDMRLISVVLGAPSDAVRTNDSQALLNWGFRFFKTQKLFSAQQSIDAKLQPRVYYGKTKFAELGFNRDIYATVPINKINQIKVATVIQPILEAPIKKGQQYGTATVTIGGEPLETVPVVALTNNPKGNIFSRAWDHITILFAKWFTTSED